MDTSQNSASRNELAILRSVLYASLFEYPLTLAELRRTLLESAQNEAEILRVYESSGWLRGLVDYREGWFFPAGCVGWITERRQREVTSRELLHRNRRLLQSICALPFVRLVALSGSIAALNADREADLDLFIVTKGRSAWTVTLAVVVLARLARRRRVVCANFVMTDQCLAVEEQDLFSASQVVQLRPLVGDDTYRAFVAANPFVGRYYPNFQAGERLAMPMEPGAVARNVKAGVELLLAVPSVAIEALCRTVYGWHLGRRAMSWRSPDQVRLSPDCLKLHTQSHRRSVLERFDRLCTETLRSAGDVRASRNADSALPQVPVPTWY